MELDVFKILWKKYARKGRVWKNRFATILASTKITPAEFAQLCVLSGRTLPLTVEFCVRFAQVRGDGYMVKPAMKTINDRFVGEGKKYSRQQFLDAITGLDSRMVSDAWRGWMLQAAGFGSSQD